MRTLGILLHIVAWYGTILLVLAAMLVGLGSATVGSVRAVRRGFARLTLRHLGQAVAVFVWCAIIGLAVVTNNNGGKVPAWLEPPPVSSLWGEGERSGEPAGAERESGRVGKASPTIRMGARR